MDFLWNLVQGGHEMQLQQYMPQPLQTQELATQTFRNGFTSGTASGWIEDLIFRVGAVPSRSRADQAGNPKFASDKQIGLYNTIAQELAQLGDQQWTQHNMQGRYSWTVSKWIKKLQDTKERLAPAQQQQQPPQGQWGQAPAPVQQQQPPQGQWGQPQPPVAAQPQWGQPVAQPVQQAPQPGFDQNGNPIPPATLDTSGPFI